MVDGQVLKDQLLSALVGSAALAAVALTQCTPLAWAELEVIAGLPPHALLLENVCRSLSSFSPLPLLLRYDGLLDCTDCPACHCLEPSQNFTKAAGRQGANLAHLHPGSSRAFWRHGVAGE